VNWFLGTVSFLLLVGVAFLSWRYIRLRRRLDEYATSLRRATQTAPSPTAFPEDVAGLENISNAVHALVAVFDLHISGVEAERAKLAAVLEQMTDGVLIADPDGRIQFANPAALRLFDTPAAIGHTAAEVLRQYQLVEAWQRARASGEQQSEAVEIPSRRLFLQLFILPDPHTAGSLLLVQDLTRVRRLEMVRRDFISNVSHELRTPLASLKALTETLRDGALEDPKVANRFLGRIETEVDALTQMAEELLELARIESGQVPLEFSQVNPAKLLEASAERMQAQAERAGLELRLEVPASLPEVRVDERRLEQVLVNLVHNAVKFTRPGGVVVLSAAMEGDFVRFAVRDTGSGIPEDDLSRIFERFYKADRARSGSGTGLGLSIARHFVEMHAGKIWAESLEGRGSTFFFTIPVN